MTIPISKMRTVNLLQVSEICFKFQETCQQRLAFEARSDKCLFADRCITVRRNPKGCFTFLKFHNSLSSVAYFNCFAAQKAVS